MLSECRHKQPRRAINSLSKGRGFGDGEGVFEANEFSATIEVARNVGVSDRGKLTIGPVPIVFGTDAGSWVGLVFVL